MRARGLKLTLPVSCLTFIAGAALAPPAVAVDRTAERYGQQLPAAVSELRLPEALNAAGADFRVDPLLKDATGPQEVIVRLKGPSVARHRDKTPSGRIGHKAKLKNDQAAFADRASKIDRGAKVLASAQMTLNAVFLEVDAAAIAELAKDPDVLHIHKVKNYEMDLSETVPYIGAAAVQGAGYDGSGVRVAVLDSGLDYYHAALGGSGDPADYAADDPTIIEPGTFPTAKVVGGYDFVGGVWPGGPVLPDPDPLDDGVAAGHGTHVGHIIGGVGSVAPGVDLYAVKVCSSVSTACSGVAMVNGMEFAVDPNGDGDPSDAVDVVNLSLGATWGQPFDDDMSFAVDNATALGVMTVASAGNGGDRPYVTGTPSSARTALSVAQTQVPSAGFQLITVDGVDYTAVFQQWSAPLAGTLSGPVQYGDGAGGNLDGCVPFPPGSLTGKIVLVDRGTCFFSTKILNIDGGGGLAGIIGLVAPGDPFAGSCGDCPPWPGIPGYMISQADSNAIKGQIGTPGDGVIDPANVLPLVGTMVASSSRGPQHDATTLLKPEIGAPGASVSAIAGTGTGEGPFGGTSGAAPMVSGSAALLIQADPGLSPAEIKARLMNNGDTNIDVDLFSGLAPITRIGGGEVRVDQALAAPAAAWDEDTMQGGLSFGFADIDSNTTTFHKRVRVRNYSGEDRSYNITPTFRFADDEANGAISVTVPPGKVRVRAHSDATFPVKVTVDGPALRDNSMSSGSMGANPSGLTTNEYDGYLVLDDGSHPIHMPWHFLPRKAASVVGRQVLDFQGGIDEIALTNNGVGTAQNDAYALIAVSENLPEGGPGEQSPTPDIRAVGVNTFPVGAGFCSAEPSFVWAFAINTWERQEHLVPVAHNLFLDTDQDGTDDYVVFNFDLSFSGSLSDGRQVTWAQDLASGNARAFFFAEHSMNTGNTVLYICGEQIGLTGTDLLSTNVDMWVYAQDWYNGGPGDEVFDLTVTPLGERYLGLPSDIPGNSVGSMTVLDFGPWPGNSDELGVMLLTNGDRGSGARGGATQGSEALLIRAR